jgi:polyphenol oxidase
VRAAGYQEQGANRLRPPGAPGKVPAMEARQPDPDPVAFWRPAPGDFPPGAGFALAFRRGGVSIGPYASLNLGLGVGDEERSVRENRRRHNTAVGIEGDEPLRLHQVHGRRIVEPRQAPCEADGFLLRAGDPWVAVSAADCAPVAIVAEDLRRGVLLHCGWRGARERIAAHAVTLLEQAGVPKESLHAAIGPCIHACCFPIGPEVAAQFDPKLLREHPSGQPALDLPEAIAAALLDVGIPRERIRATPDCTSCLSDLYFSHRRDRGVTGRHWAILRLPAPSA